MIELIITIVIISLGAGVLYSYIAAVTRSPEPVVRQTAIMLGRGLMEEIVSKRWDENTPVGGGVICTTETTTGCVSSASPIGAEEGSRSDWDDVDDYDGLTEQNNFTGQDGCVTTINGASRSVDISYIPSSSTTVTATSPPGSTSSATDIKRIVVTITTPAGETFQFVTLRSNY